MQIVLPLIAAGLIAASAYARPGWTLDECVDHWGSPYGAFLDHLRIGHNDFGICNVYEWRDHKVYILRHDVGVIKAETICDAVDLF